MYQDLKNKVLQMVGNDYLNFNERLTIKPAPHRDPFDAWSLCVSPAGTLYLMTGDRNWWDVKETDAAIVAALEAGVNNIANAKNNAA